MRHTRTINITDRKGNDGEVNVEFDWDEVVEVHTSFDGSPGTPALTNFTIIQWTANEDKSDDGFNPTEAQVENYLWENFEP